MDMRDDDQENAGQKILTNYLNVGLVNTAISVQSDLSFNEFNTNIDFKFWLTCQMDS